MDTTAHTAAARTGTLRVPADRGQAIGALIAGSFGLVFVWVNSGLLADGVALALRVAGAVAFVAVVVAAQLTYRAMARAGREGLAVPGPDRPPFRGAFWVVTAVEAVAIIVGVRVISQVFDAPEAGVAWVALVVGVHFVPLARLFRHASFMALAVVMSALGLAGLVMAVLGVGAAPIALVSGVGSGALLIGWALWGATRRVEISR